MKLRYGIAGAVLILGLAVGGIATAIVGGDAGDDGGTETAAQGVPFVGLTISEATALAEDEGRPWRIGRQDDEELVLTDDLVPGRVTFEIDEGTVTSAVIERPSTPSPGDGPTDPATQSESFVGLTISEATALAEDEGRPWRIGRQDDEEFGFDGDLVPGRVTFEIDEGTVTSATIEHESVPPPGDAIVEDPARADLIAVAVKRLLTVDNSFGGVDVFDDIRIARVVGSDPDQPLGGLDLDLIDATLSELGAVRYIDDADAEIGVLFEESPAGVAVVSVEDILLLDDRAEVELRLWCGSLCGVFVTYEAVPDDGGWNIVGTVGPIAMS